MKIYYKQNEIVHAVNHFLNIYNTHNSDVIGLENIPKCFKKEKLNYSDILSSEVESVICYHTKTSLTLYFETNNSKLHYMRTGERIGKEATLIRLTLSEDVISDYDLITSKERERKIFQENKHKELLNNIDKVKSELISKVFKNASDDSSLRHIKFEFDLPPNELYEKLKDQLNEVNDILASVAQRKEAEAKSKKERRYSTNIVRNTVGDDYSCLYNSSSCASSGTTASNGDKYYDGRDHYAEHWSDRYGWTSNY